MVTTLPDRVSPLPRHLSAPPPQPDATFDAREIPSVDRVMACLDDLEALVAREARANGRLRAEAAARGRRIERGFERLGAGVEAGAGAARAPILEAAACFDDGKLRDAGAHVTHDRLAGEDRLLGAAHGRLERRQSLQTTIEGFVSCAKTEALLPRRTGKGWALAVKEAETWGRAALEAEPVPDVARMARDGRAGRTPPGRARRRSRDAKK